MKIALTALALMLSMSVMSAPAPIKIESLIGSYVATDPACHYKFARIKVTEDYPEFKNALVVETSGDRHSGAHAFHHFNLNEMGKTIKKTKNAENLKTRQLLTNDRISSETMGCLSNWLFCGPWNVDMIVKKINEQNIQISQSKNDPGCTYSKVTLSY